MPKAAYRSHFRENTETSRQRGFDAGTSRAACKRATTRPLRPAKRINNIDQTTGGIRQRDTVAGEPLVVSKFRG